MLDTFVPLFGGLPGGPELIVILLIIVLLFGAQKLPKLARSTGEAMGEFQKGREEVEQELQEMREGKKREEGLDEAPPPSEETDSETVIGEAESDTTTDTETDTERN
ncbi:Sec-independent protein translocase subunit TatA/TatB [Haloglomus litoreum]|uniref:Sec-independent protein translocase subunit TatA/TatB n=1 Tax=Haloglomus litoreum TaxID=3034026 RepID=UPI0023E8CF1A|nr:twin-arginine translocase TatA/TatE family subunit [Haloglomus sp. DT116]